LYRGVDGAQCLRNNTLAIRRVAGSIGLFKRVFDWFTGFRWAHRQLLIPLVAALLIIEDTFFRPLSTVSLGLTVLALSPWLLESIKSFELPGIGKLELREKLDRLTEEAKESGLLAEPEGAEKPATYETIYSDDPTLALAGLRIELEKRINQLSQLAGLVGDNRPRGNVLAKARALQENRVLSTDEFHVFLDLIPLLNEAVHAGEYNLRAADWAIQTGPKLLAGLDHKIATLKHAASPAASGLGPEGAHC
jgi:hypothetical protein